MNSAKDLIVKPISAQDANKIIKELHYSGKVVNNSQLHLGIFLNEKCGGAMQFGPSLDKRKIQGLVSGTLWNEFIELNRMAFADWLPRYGESRCIGYAMRWIRKQYPQIKWVVSFSDATQCGDGIIYRASGFILTGIKENNQIWEAPDSKGKTFSRMALTDKTSGNQKAEAKTIISRTTTTKGNHILGTGASSMKQYKTAGWKPKKGFQLRYIFFIDKNFKEKLTVPILPFSIIDKMGARMYKGISLCAESKDDVAPDNQSGESGLIPTSALHLPSCIN